MGFRADLYTQDIFVHTNDVFTTERQCVIINQVLTTTRGLIMKKTLIFVMTALLSESYNNCRKVNKR